MNAPTSSMKVFGFGLLLAVPLFAAGCGNSAQEKAYEHAAQMDQSYTAETAPAIVDAYRQVITLEPGSGLAQSAQARITAIESRMKALEEHKDVFQEHGVD